MLMTLLAFIFKSYVDWMSNTFNLTQGSIGFYFAINVGYLLVVLAVFTIIYAVKAIDILRM